MAQHAPVRSALEDVEGIGRCLVAGGAVAEIDFAVRRDVEIVGHPHAGIVVELVPGAIGLVGDLEYFATGLHAVHAHAADADDQILVTVELHAVGTAADVGEHFAMLKRSPEKRMMLPSRVLP